MRETSNINSYISDLKNQQSGTFPSVRCLIGKTYGGEIFGEYETKYQRHAAD
jgi:hypothetical protein